jgi:hypothetical protein
MANPAKFNNSIDVQGMELGVARVRVEYTDFSETDTSETITWAAAAAFHPQGSLGSIPANAKIMDAWVVRIADFAGGSVTAVTVDLGDSGNDDELLDAADLFTGAKATAAVSNADGIYSLGSIESAYVPQLVFTTVGANLDDLTAGACEICISYQALATTSKAPT